MYDVFYAVLFGLLKLLSYDFHLAYSDNSNVMRYINSHFRLLMFLTHFSWSPSLWGI